MTKKIAKVSIVYDQDAQSPREDDELVMLAIGSPRRPEGDTSHIKQVWDSKGNGDVAVTLNNGLTTRWSDIEKGVVNRRKVVALRTYRYSHSCDFYFTEAYDRIHTIPDWQWDVSFVGFTFMFESDFCKLMKKRRMSEEMHADARQILQGAVAVYSAWVNGETYGVEVETAEVEDDFDVREDDLEGVVWEFADYCGGYIELGDRMIEEARSVAEEWAKETGNDVAIIRNDEVEEFVTA